MEATLIHRQVLIAMVAGLSLLGFVAIAIGGRLLPAALLASSVVTLVLGCASGTSTLWWVPRGLGITMLPVAILALASAGQVIEQTRWRPRWLRTWLGR